MVLSCLSSWGGGGIGIFGPGMDVVEVAHGDSIWFVIKLGGPIGSSLGGPGTFPLPPLVSEGFVLPLLDGLLRGEAFLGAVVHCDLGP